MKRRSSHVLALLFDLPAAGGLLAGISRPRVDACLAGPRSAGNVHAAILGRVARTGLPASEAGVGLTGMLGKACGSTTEREIFDGPEIA
jgi:hypothetical protein